MKVQARANFWYQFPDAMEMNQEAQRGCSEYGNIVSHALSERCVDVEGVSGLCVRKEYLYACKSPEAEFHNPHESHFPFSNILSLPNNVRQQGPEGRTCT